MANFDISAFEEEFDDFDEAAYMDWLECNIDSSRYSLFLAQDYDGGYVASWYGKERYRAEKERA